MGRVLELLTGFVTAPSTTNTALTMAAGNSLTLRDSLSNGYIALLSAWTDQQTAGTLRILSSLMHDASQGIRLYSPASEVRPLLPFRPNQRLSKQDVLTVTLTGSGTSGDVETACLLVYYSDSPGAAQRLISIAECAQRSRNIMGVENTLSLGTAGGYSGEEAINTEYDLGKAGVDYALLGYLVSAECACVRWRGADTSNIGVGGPGNELEKEVTRNWFAFMSEQTNLPTIPVFNFSNKGSILLDGAQDENGTDTLVTSIFMELGPPSSTPRPA